MAGKQIGRSTEGNRLYVTLPAGEIEIPGEVQSRQENRTAPGTQTNTAPSGRTRVVETGTGDVQLAFNINMVPYYPEWQTIADAAGTQQTFDFRVAMDKLTAQAATAGLFVDADPVGNFTLHSQASGSHPTTTTGIAPQDFLEIDFSGTNVYFPVRTVTLNTSGAVTGGKFYVPNGMELASNREITATARKQFAIVQAPASTPKFACRVVDAPRYGSHDADGEGRINGDLIIAPSSGTLAELLYGDSAGAATDDSRLTYTTP